MGTQTDQFRLFAPGHETVDVGAVQPQGTVNDAEAATHAGAPPRPSHVLVCISGATSDLRLMRQGWLLAGRLHARTTVLYVLSAAGEARPVEALTGVRLFAESLSASLVELPAFSVVDGIVEYVAKRNVTHLVLSESHGARRSIFGRGSLLDELLQRLEGIDVYVLADSAERPGAVAEPGRQQG
jgi:two-component system, OmpR family, sensor histidine kinase KdpD